MQGNCFCAAGRSGSACLRNRVHLSPITWLCSMKGALCNIILPDALTTEGFPRGPQRSATHAKPEGLHATLEGSASVRLTRRCLCAGQLNGGNNVLNPYVNGNVNASSVAQQLVTGATAAGQLAR